MIKIIVFLMALLIVLAIPIYASSLHLLPIEDTYANTLENQDHGDMIYLNIGSYTTSNSYGFMKFDISAVPLGQFIYQANLCIWITENYRYANESMFEIRNVTNQIWTEHGINNTGQMPTIYNNVTYANMTDNVNNWYCFDVTNLTNYYYKSGFKNATYELNTTPEYYYHFGIVKSASKEASYPETVEFLNISYYYANASYDYCYDEYTLITGSILLYNGKEYNFTNLIHCPDRCDNVTNSCIPQQYQQDLTNFGIIIVIFACFVLFALFMRKR